MSEKRILLTSEVRKLSDMNKQYIEVEMVISTTSVNLNGVLTTPEFLRKSYDGIVSMPLQVDKAKLEAGLTSNLTHLWDGNSLNTQSVGVFTESWLETSQDDDDDITMVGRARIWKRYPKTVEEVIKLYNDDDLKFSWELLVTEDTEENGIIEIHEAMWEAHCIVSTPAYPEAQARQLIAELNINNGDNTNQGDIINTSDMDDTNQQEEGGESVDMKKTLAEVLKEKSMDEVRAEISQAIRNQLSETEGAYVYTMYQTVVIAEIYSTETWEGEYYGIPYSLSENDEISVDMESKKVASRTWVLEDSEEVMISEEVAKDFGDRKISETETKLSELENEKSELEIKISELEEKLRVSEETEPTEPVDGEEGETQVSEEDDNDDVDLAKKVIELSEAIERLQTENEVLKPFRDKVVAEEEEKERLEKEAEMTRLSEMVSKYIKEDEEGNKEIPEEVQTFISELNEDKVCLWIGKTISSRNYVLSSEVKNDEEDDDTPIVVGTSEGENLVKTQEEFKLV